MALTVGGPVRALGREGAEAGVERVEPGVGTPVASGGSESGTRVRQLGGRVDAVAGERVHGRERVGHFYQLNEMFQHAAAKTCEAIICAMPQIMQDTEFSLMQLSRDPQSFSHRCNCVNMGLSNPLEPNYLAVIDTHFEMGGQSTHPLPAFASQQGSHSETLSGQELDTPHNKCYLIDLQRATQRARAQFFG